MANAVWTGRISFGLVNVPVKLFTAIKTESVSFKLLRKSDHSRIRGHRQRL
jgi:DNA end-binding protein Ku